VVTVAGDGVMYVVTDGSYCWQLIGLAKADFDQISKIKFKAMPVYYLFYEGKLRVWPKPAEGYVVCKLVPEVWE
jgi:hypothetical protein